MNLTQTTSPRETALWVAAIFGLLLAIFGPSIAQNVHYHAFADQRVLWGIPFAIDVLSNLPFVVAGLIGLSSCWAHRRALASKPPGSPFSQPDPTTRFTTLFFVGLIVTAIGSIYYHLAPDDAALVVDRLGMVCSFAGILGIAAGQRIGARAGVATVIVVLLMGPVSIYVWSQTGNLLPWSVLQGGGMLMLLALAACHPVRLQPTAANQPAAVALLPVVLIYALAKILELADHQVFELTQQWVSGHSFKHAVAAFAACPVISFMHNQNKTLALKMRAPGASRQDTRLNQSHSTV